MPTRGATSRRTSGPTTRPAQARRSSEARQGRLARRPSQARRSAPASRAAPRRHRRGGRTSATRRGRERPVRPRLPIERRMVRVAPPEPRRWWRLGRRDEETKEQGKEPAPEPVEAVGGEAEAVPVLGEPMVASGVGPVAAPAMPATDADLADLDLVDFADGSADPLAPMPGDVAEEAAADEVLASGAFPGEVPADRVRVFPGEAPRDGA